MTKDTLTPTQLKEKPMTQEHSQDQAYVGDSAQTALEDRDQAQLRDDAQGELKGQAQTKPENHAQAEEDHIVEPYLESQVEDQKEPGSHMLEPLPESEIKWSPAVPIPDNPLRWGETFQKGAKKKLPDEQMRKNLHHATRTIRNKRALRQEEMPDWEDLRMGGSTLKFHTMSNLDSYLLELEENITKNGGIVHWARDAREANEIVLDIIREEGVDEVLKVKSMLTQEIGLNEFLKDHGVMAWETDLAEMIVQLSDDMPSHIVVPAIHRNRTEVREIFKARMGDAPENLTDNPRELAMAARAHLRKKFLHNKVAISGANVMAASSGTLSIYESEGNGRMCLTLAETLISLVGIEKTVPNLKDNEIIGQLLPRCATGERMNPYTSMWSGVCKGDGPQKVHVVFLDNGRTKVLSDPVGRQALHCIRCGACMNACPVYDKVGGHAYNSVYPGPIGAILTPQLLGSFDKHDPAASLPFASSLCNACYEACPMRIDIPTCLVHLRHKITEKNRGTIDGYKVGMKAMVPVMSSGAVLGWSSKRARALKLLTGKNGNVQKLPFNMVNGWTDYRDIPGPPQQTFREWFKKHEKEGDK